MKILIKSTPTNKLEKLFKLCGYEHLDPKTIKENYKYLRFDEDSLTLSISNINMVEEQESSIDFLLDFVETLNTLSDELQARTVEDLFIGDRKGIMERGGTSFNDEKFAQNDTEKALSNFLKGMKQLLLEKNRKYGNSLHDSKTSITNLPVDVKIMSRIEDKINRLVESEEPQEDDVLDLIGYLVHYAVHKGYTP